MTLAACSPQWRKQGDPLLDPVVDTRLNASWLPLTGRNADPLGWDVPAAVAARLEGIEVPAEAQSAAIARAQRWANGQLLPLSLSLLGGSLPLLFAGAKGAAVLHATRRLLDDVDRRVNETGRFVLAVVQPGGFAPQGHAVRACLTTRVVHAMVRARSGMRHSAEVAINQQDMVGTLLAFAVVSFRGMKRLGAATEAHHAQDWWQLWRVVGALLGIDPTIVPATYEQAERTLEVFLDTVVEPSGHGRALTAALLDGMARHMGSPDAAARLVRHLLGDRMAEVLDVPAPVRSRLGEQIVGGSAPLADRLGPRLSRWVMESIVDHKLRPASPG